jgi:hypothetical protein
VRRPGRFVERVRTLPPIAADAALALGLTTYGFIELRWFGWNPDVGPCLSCPPFHLSGWSFVVLAMMSLPLVLRRRNIALSYALIQATTLLGILAHVETNLLQRAGDIFMIILIFAVADQAPAWVAILAMFAEMGILLWVFAMQNHFPDPVQIYYEGMGYYFPRWAFPLFVGWAQRRRRALTTRLEARAEDFGWSANRSRRRPWPQSGFG